MFHEAVETVILAALKTLSRATFLIDFGKMTPSKFSGQCWNMNKIIPPAGPYLSAQDAAAYLAFNYDHFRILARKHRIPRRGPSKNRFAVTDLDAFMADSQCFLEKPTEVKPVKRKIQTIPV